MKSILVIMALIFSYVCAHAAELTDYAKNSDDTVRFFKNQNDAIEFCKNSFNRPAHLPTLIELIELASSDGAIFVDNNYCKTKNWVRCGGEKIVNPDRTEVYYLYDWSNYLLKNNIDWKYHVWSSSTSLPPWSSGKGFDFNYGEVITIGGYFRSAAVRCVLD
ncbi:MAG: hypothetical protein IPM97_07070 [Bdellovibrionaceae bacterium]|nr:hypothetical protein [Pseudobdellovibrionaceae bacterium]